MRTIQNTLLILLSTLFALVLIEGALRVFTDQEYYVWPPNLSKIFKPNTELMPGVYNNSQFEINSIGLRGDEEPDHGRYKILTLGGSTTECLYLDQTEAWPEVLQTSLIDNFEDASIWVGNAGKSGKNTRHHIVQLEKLLDRHPDTNAVIFLTGINDLSYRLAQDLNYRPLSEITPAQQQAIIDKAFSIHPEWNPNDSYLKNTRIWQTLSRLRHSIKNSAQNGPQQDEVGDIYAVWRAHRQHARLILDELPKLTTAINEYSENINQLIDTAEQRNVRIIFLTQPTMWRNDLPEELSKLLWFGGIGDFQKEDGKNYYSVDALAKGINMYNAALLRVCEERHVECIDVASQLPKDTSTFYDDVHFNESGAHKLAEIIAGYLIDTGIETESPIKQ